MRPGDLVFSRFEIERRAGSGAMGTVYRARDATTGATVALKVLSGTEAIDAERFTREAAVLAALTHPAIVRYVAHGTEGEQHYLAMEWLEGEDLAERLARQPIGIREAVALVRKVAEALSVAHARGVVHRDIKPSNLFLVDGDPARVKILDFGIARLTREGRGVTLTGAMLGTPGYMAPEQAQGVRAIEARADVFSLGCVLFKCITGRPPFGGENVLAILAKTILEDAPPLSEVRPDVPPALEALVARLLARDPAARPADGAEAAALLAALGDLGGEAPEEIERRRALTANERRVVCVVLVGGPSGMPADGATMASDAFAARDSALRAAVESHGGRLDFLADGSLLVALAGTAATDQAARAARCAIELSGVLADVPMALVTGVSSEAGAGASDLVDRGVALLERGPLPRGVWLDDATAGLLDVRFDVRSQPLPAEAGPEVALYLYGERDVVEGTRTLLGRPYGCVGRDRELAFLDAVFDEASADSVARAVLVTAPAGRGKSRVRFEFLQRRARAGDGFALLFGRGDSMAVGSPFGIVAPAIRRSAGILDDDPLPRKQKRLRARLGRHLSRESAARVAELIGEMIGVPFSDEGSPALRAARRDAMLMGDAMLAAWLEWLEAETAEETVLLVLEDLHWGDLPTVRFVDAALERLANRPLMVLALARPEVHAQFPGLWAERELQELKLGPLTPRASASLARQALGDVDEATVARVVDRAGGNAFYLEELIRAVAAGATGAVLPDSVLAMVQARLDALGADAKRVLRAASVFGQIFWRGGVVALLGGEAVGGGVGDWLDELCAREVIARRGAARAFQGELEFIFRHALLRDAAYAMLTDHDRSLGHRLAGGWLEGAGERDPMVLAEHYERGGEPWRAVSCYRRAAEHALEGNDLAAALARAERGIALRLAAPDRRGSSSDPPPSARPPGERRFDDVLGALRLTEAEAHKWRGELVQAERAGAEAAERLPPGSVPWFRAVGELVALAGQRGDIATAQRWIEEASSITMAQEELGAQVVCLCRGIMTLLHAGLNARADGLLTLVEHVAAGLSKHDRGAAARLHQARAARALQSADLGVALDEFAAAASALAAAGDARTLALVHINLGVVWAELGVLDRAEDVLRDARASADRMGLSNVRAWAQNNLGNVLGAAGSTEAARAALDEAIAAGEAQGNVRLEVSSRVYLAHMAARSGDAVTAERQARAALATAGAIAPMRAPALGALCRALLARGDAAAEAVSLAREALALLDAIDATEGDSEVRLAAAEALAASGDRSGARSVAALAQRRVVARAERITDASLRASFLAVPVNAKTVRLCAELGGQPAGAEVAPA